MHLVPFDFTIQKADIDKEFPQKLLAEAEGILAWAVRGARKWYAEGLDKPKKVQEALDKWSKEDDQLGRFIEACCVIGETLEIGARQLYKNYSDWVEEAGEMPVSEPVFALRMSRRPEFTKVERRKGYVYQGIGLRTDLDPM
jgi:putative DNA primase/helicase